MALDKYNISRPPHAHINKIAALQLHLQVYKCFFQVYLKATESKERRKMHSMEQKTDLFLYFNFCRYFITQNTMDHSPIRQTFELGKFISTAGKSIINLVKL